MREKYEKLYWRIKFTAIGLLATNGLVDCMLDYHDMKALIAMLAILLWLLMWFTKKILPFDRQSQILTILTLAASTTNGALAVVNLNWDLASLFDSAITVATAVLMAFGDLALLSYWQSSNPKPRCFRLK